MIASPDPASHLFASACETIWMLHPALRVWYIILFKMEFRGCAKEKWKDYEEPDNILDLDG